MDSEPEAAQTEFAVSAKEVIDVLRSIEGGLNAQAPVPPTGDSVDAAEST
jgi:hypothetical protein